MRPTVCGACGWVIYEDVESCPACKTPLECQPEEEPDATDSPGADEARPAREHDSITGETRDQLSPSPWESGTSDDAWKGVGAFDQVETESSNVSDEGADVAYQIKEASLDHSVEERGLLFLLLSPFGRIGRLAFLLGFLLVVALYATAMLGGVSALPLGADEDAGEMVGRVITILALVVMLQLTIKRFHDFDVSGWGTLAVLLCGALIVPIIALIEGTRGRNRFGCPTRMRWSPLSAAMTVVLLGSGVYSAAMLANLIAIENRYEIAFAEHERAPSDSTQRQMKEICEDASWGRKWCPFCGSFTAYEMYASWAYGATLYERQQWRDAAEWLEKSVRASERLRRSANVREIEADLLDIRLEFADALEAAGELDQAADLRAELADKLSGPALAGRIDKTTELSTKGRLHLDREEYEKAQTVFTELIEIRQSQLAARSSDQQVRSTLGANFHDRALARFNLGDLDGAQADVREAIELQTVAINVAPELSQCLELLGLHHELLGQLYLERGDADAALEAFEKACEVNPASVAHRWKAAWTRYDRLEFDKIVDLLSDFLRNAEELHLEYLLSVSLLYEGRNDRAEQVIERLRSRHRESVEGHFLHGVVEMMKRDYADAVQSLGKAYQQKPGDPAILFNLSVSLAHANRKSEAQRVMAELSAIDSMLAERVRRYLQSGGRDEAIQPMFELSFGS